MVIKAFLVHSNFIVGSVSLLLLLGLLGNTSLLSYPKKFSAFSLLPQSIAISAARLCNLSNLSALTLPQQLHTVSQ